MDNIVGRADSDNELQHYGTKGMRWGIRRYQNKDGSLTKAGEARYNKEMESLKNKSKSLTEEHKRLSSSQKKLDSLDRMRSKVASKEQLVKSEKALLKTKKFSERQAERAKIKQMKAEMKAEKDAAKQAELKETKKKEVLASRSPKELYDNADLFTYEELNNAYNRLNLESRISSMVPKEVGKGEQYVNKISSTGKKAKELYDTGSDIYNAAATLHNTFSKTGRDKPWPIIKKGNDDKKKDKNKNNDDNDNNSNNNNNNNNNNRNNTNQNSQNNQNKTQNQNDSRGSTNTNSSTTRETWSGTVEGKGTSTSDIKRKMDAGKNYFDSNSTVHDMYVDSSGRAYEAGERYVAGYLERDGNR